MSLVTTVTFIFNTSHRGIKFQRLIHYFLDVIGMLAHHYDVTEFKDGIFDLFRSGIFSIELRHHKAGNFTVYEYLHYLWVDKFLLVTAIRAIIPVDDKSVSLFQFT